MLQVILLLASAFLLSCSSQVDDKPSPAENPAPPGEKNVPTAEQTSYLKNWPAYSSHAEGTKTGLLNEAWGSKPFAYGEWEGRVFHETHPGMQPLHLGGGSTLFMDDHSMAVLSRMSEARYELKRIDANGDIDQNYGKNGIVNIEIAGVTRISLLDAVVLPENSLVLFFQDTETRKKIYILKIAPDGKMAKEFGEKGLVKVSSEYSFPVIRVGRASHSEIMILDPNCSSFPTTHTKMSISTGTFRSVGQKRVQPTKHILATEFLPNGYSIGASCSLRPFTNCAEGVLIERWKPDGTPDETFGSKGSASVSWDNFLPLASPQYQSFSLKLAGTKTGDTLLSWSINSGIVSGKRLWRAYIVKVLQNGEMDKAFGNSGKLEIFDLPDHECTDGSGSEPSQPVEVDNGRILIATGGDKDVCLLGLDANGKADTKFGKEGISKIGTGFGAIKTDNPLGPNGYFRLSNFQMYVGPSGKLTVTYSTNSGMLDRGVIGHSYLY
jgi:hypothetical protein